MASAHPQAIARLMPLNEALALVEAQVKAIVPAKAPIMPGRVLAENVIAPARPAAAIALRDGWAIAADDTLGAGSYSPASLGRAPVIWDNWPQSITALYGRSADLSSAAAGLLSNPVICSWEAMPATSFTDVTGTAGLYAWRTSTYDATTALDRWRAARAAP